MSLWTSQSTLAAVAESVGLQLDLLSRLAAQTSEDVEQLEQQRVSWLTQCSEWHGRALAIGSKSAQLCDKGTAAEARR